MLRLLGCVMLAGALSLSSTAHAARIQPQTGSVLPPPAGGSRMPVIKPPSAGAGMPVIPPPDSARTRSRPAARAKPPQTGRMPVIPPPEGGTTPIIPPPAMGRTPVLPPPMPK